SANGIMFIDARPFVTQEVFTKIDPVTGRPSYDPERKPRADAAVTFCPGLWGGKDWTPAGYNPKTNYLYIPANENLCSTLVGKQGTQRWESKTNSGITGVPSSFAIDGVQHIAVQSGWGVDAQRMQARLDTFLGTKTDVPQGGVLWVFALRD